MRTLELEGPSEVILPDLQLRTSIPSAVFQFDVTWLRLKTFVVCLGSEKYIPFRPWNTDSVGMVYLWPSLAAFRLGSWNDPRMGNDLEGALEHVGRRG